MNATATTAFYLACNACSIALTDAGVPVDPKVEEKFSKTGRLVMGAAHDLTRNFRCDFCENETDRVITWELY